jgi:hypothetical protein
MGKGNFCILHFALFLIVMDADYTDGKGAIIFLKIWEISLMSSASSNLPAETQARVGNTDAEFSL